MTKTAIATKKDQLPAATSNESMFSDVPAEHINPESSRGQENVTRGDMSIPRLEVLQDTSPQAMKRDPEYIEGAESGMLFNTVSKELYGTHVAFIPTYFKLEWLIWKKQGAGGGFNGAFESEALAKAEYAERGFGTETFKNSSGVVEDAYELVDTAQQYGLVVHQDGSMEQIVCSMSKSKMKASRQLNTLINMVGGDRFARAYKISPSLEKNAAGQEYWGLKVGAMGYVNKHMFEQAEKMYESLKATPKSPDYGQPTPAAAESEY